jgi:hypothetical protein
MWSAKVTVSGYPSKRKIKKKAAIKMAALYYILLL